MTHSITLFKDTNFRGQSATFTENIENLKNYKFNDETSSCKITGGQCILYSDTDFQGTVVVLEPGDYADFKDLPIGNDTLSGFRFLPLKNSGNHIAFFEDTGYRGAAALISADQPNFKDFNFNDETSSIIVTGGNWELFQNTKYGGSMWMVNENGGPTLNGRYPNSSSFKNDSVSSAKLV